MADAPRQRRDLTLDEVIDRAIEIAQAEGEHGLTMRRVAEACGVTPMALYHHVENKESLLTAIVDRVVADAIGDLDRETGGRAAETWRADLVEFACRFRRGFMSHPTAAQVYLRRPILSESLARCTELMFDAFDRGGISGTAMAEATDAVVLLMMGSIANDLTRPPEIRYQLTDQLPSDKSVLLREQIDEYSRRDGEERFRQSLGWLLDGLITASA